MNLITDLLYPCEKFVHDGIEKPYGISILRKALERKSEVKKISRGLSDEIRESLLILLTSSKKHMRYKNHVR